MKTVFVLIEDSGITILSKGGLLKMAKEKYDIRTRSASVALKGIKNIDNNITLYEDEVQ